MAGFEQGDLDGMRAGRNRWLEQTALMKELKEFFDRLEVTFGERETAFVLLGMAAGLCKGADVPLSELLDYVRLLYERGDEFMAQLDANKS
jgi:hypothetical protein